MTQSDAIQSGCKGRLFFEAFQLWFVFLSQIHIISLFVEDGGAFAVAGIDGGVVGQAEQAFLDAGDEGLVVATGQVGAAYAAAEERVAGEDPAFDFSIEADAAPCVARRANHLQSALPYLDKLAVGKTRVRQVHAGFAFFRKAQPSRVTLGLSVVVVHIGMCGHLDTITALHHIIAHHMVDMAVCVDNHQRIEPVTVDEAEEAVSLVGRGATGIDDKAFFGVVVINDVGVFGKRVENEGFEFEHG